MFDVNLNKFLSDIRRLVTTIVVKSEHTANAQNLYLTYRDGYVVSDDKSTWKYYLNLNGQYHKSQKIMKVISMDNSTEIDFTVENLAIHTATANAYRFGTVHYIELTNKYPTQVLLINGILHPVDMDTAISSPENTILWIDKTLIETQETNLIYELQNYLYIHYRQYFQETYAYDLLGEDLYAPAYYANLCVAMLGYIMTIRLNNCFTNKAHSYHVWEYLSSHNRLDRYKDYLTSEQIFFLYRNITYLEKYAGHNDTYNILIQKLLTDINIPISDYKLEQRYETMPDDVLPSTVMHRIPINIINGESMEEKDFTVKYVLDKEDSLAVYNPSVRDDTETKLKEDFGLSILNKLPTKVLESEVSENTSNQIFTLSDFLINEWLHLSTHGIYNANIVATNPQSGDNMPMTVKDAFVLYYYCVLKHNGITPTLIPNMQAQHVRRIPLPNKDNVLKIIDTSILNRSMIDYLYSIQTPITPMISVSAFATTVKSIYRNWLDHESFYTLRIGALQRAEAQKAVNQMYAIVNCPTIPNKNYEDWFLENNWEIDILDLDELETLGNNLVKLATNYQDTNEVTIVDIQKAMLNLLMDLTTYTIQAIPTITSIGLYPLQYPMTRLINFALNPEYTYYIDGITRILSASVIPKYKIREDFYNPIVVSNTTFVPKLEANIDVGVTLDNSGVAGNDIYLSAASVRLWIVDDTNIDDRIPNNTLGGLYLDTIDPKFIDIDKRITVPTLNGLVLDPVISIDDRIIYPDLDGFFIDARSNLDQRIPVIELRGLYVDPTDKDISVRITNDNLNGLFLDPLKK